MAKTNKTDFALLGILTTEAMSGYDLRSYIRQSIGYFWQESYGQIYPALRRLHAKRLVSKKRAKESQGPARYVYSITGKGKSVLAQWLASEPEPETVRNELLLRLFFGAMGERTHQIRHVESLLERQRHRLSQFEMVNRELQQHHTDEPSYPYWCSTLSYGLHITRARVAWCEEILTWLKNGGPNV